MTVRPPFFALDPILEGPSDAGQIAALKTFARAADAAGFDLLMVGDPETRLTLEPLTTAMALAAATRRIGLAAAVRTDLGEPFSLARGFAAFDHLSRGRSAWRVRTGADSARDREFLAVAFALWASWEADAVVFDKARARFSDPDKVNRIDHRGDHFQVRGPLNTPRPLQDRPLIIVDADADPDWIAQTADVVVGSARSEHEARAAGGALQTLALSRGRALRFVVDCAWPAAGERADWVRRGACDGLVIQVPLDQPHRLAALAATVGVSKDPQIALRARLQQPA
jgi:alkanesulfonate monooxygenase SsuD/methylene tetrahydromethanopterin reductase-like flavin-dependent oxidoreductase (luciferase family)